MEPFCCAVVVAAGGSVRMGGAVAKPFLPLLGVPVVVRTLMAFQSAEEIGAVVLVCRAEDSDQMRTLAQKYKITKLTALVCGGETRQRSVAAGVAAVPESAEFLAIHDGARPLITAGEISAVLKDAFLHGASALAVPVKDTVKAVDSNGFVAATPERRVLWAVQTPQVFARAPYMAALSAAKGDYTDDCQLFEQAGLPVHLCPGSYENLKLTTAEDVGAAEAILRKRGEAP